MTILCHFFNEEYLLPFWLNHHKRFFSHGIMVNYNSNDKSVEIIKEICPTWEIVESRNHYFTASDIDSEIMNIEKSIDGFRICLNVTEFLLGDFSILNKIKTPSQILIPSLTMVDDEQHAFTEINGELFKNRTFGFGYDGVLFSERYCRSLHNYNVNYPLGRHFTNINTNDFIILFYRYSPFNEGLIKRKLQIQTRMRDTEKSSGIGGQHLLDREKLIGQLVSYQRISEDLSGKINKFLRYCNI